MRKILLIAVLCIYSVQVYGTAQIPDRIIIGRDTLSLFELPLYEIEPSRLAEFERRLKEINGGEGLCSGLWRDYMGIWELRNDTLLLQKVLDSRAALGEPGGSTVPMDGIVEVGKPASWFSGDIRVASGPCIYFQHDAFMSRFLNETIYTIENGVVTGKRQLDNRMIGHRGNFENALFHIQRNFKLPDTPDPSPYIRITGFFSAVPTPEGYITEFAEIELTLWYNDESSESVEDPEHPYVKAFLQRIQQLEPCAVWLEGEILPLRGFINLK